MDDKTKFYRWNPEAITKCSPEKQIELWNGLMLRLTLIYDALELSRKRIKELEKGLCTAGEFDAKIQAMLKDDL